MHSHFSYRAADVILYASILAEIAYSISAHVSFCGIWNLKQKWRNAASGICVSHYVKDLVIKTVGKGYIANGSRCDAFKRTNEYTPYDNDTPLRIFFAGRFITAKGHHTLIESISQIVKLGVNVQLNIAGIEIGGKTYSDELNNLIVKPKSLMSGFNSWVRFHQIT